MHKKISIAAGKKFSKKKLIEERVMHDIENRAFHQGDVRIVEVINY